jgi:hypothetical protein
MPPRTTERSSGTHRALLQRRRWAVSARRLLSAGSHADEGGVLEGRTTGRIMPSIAGRFTNQRSANVWAGR